MKLADFGFTEGINEIIGITFGEWINTTPLGLIVEDADTRFAKIRLYSNHTRENLRKKSEIWINVTRDPVIFALSAFKDLDESYFESLNPPIIHNSLVWCRFHAELKGMYAHLTLKEGEIVRYNLRPVNRGFNAIIEALVHSTRMISLKDEKLMEKVNYYLNLAEKCGSEREKVAVNIIREHIHDFSGV